MTASLQPDARQMAAFSARAEQLLKEWVELWPYYTDPEVDSALQAYALQQLQARMAPDATVRIGGANSEIELLWNSSSNLIAVASPRLQQIEWLDDWQADKRAGGQIREMKILLVDSVPLSAIKGITFILRPTVKTFGDQKQVVWEVRIWEVVVE